MRTYLFVLLLAVAAPARAQDIPDAGLPDASVEQGGADRNTEENDTQGGPCLDSQDCTQGFTCVEARCIPTRPRTVGCSLAPAGALVAGALFLVLRRRARS